MHIHTGGFRKVDKGQSNVQVIHLYLHNADDIQDLISIIYITSELYVKYNEHSHLLFKLLK